MLSFVLSLVGLFSQDARADEPAEPTHKAQVFLTAGAFGVISARGEWDEEFLYAGPSVLLRASDHVMVIPSVVVEWAPRTRTWGVAATVTVEYEINEHVAIDLVPSVLRDTIEDRVQLSLCAGPGATYVWANHVSLSGAIQGAVTLGPNRHWATIPSVALNIPLSHRKR